MESALGLLSLLDLLTWFGANEDELTGAAQTALGRARIHAPEATLSISPSVYAASCFSRGRGSNGCFIQAAEETRGHGAM